MIVHRMLMMRIAIRGPNHQTIRHSPAAAARVLESFPISLLPTEPSTELSQYEITPTQWSSLEQSFPENLSPSAETMSTEANTTTRVKRRTHLRAMMTTASVKAFCRTGRFFQLLVQL